MSSGCQSSGSGASNNTTESGDFESVMSFIVGSSEGASSDDTNSNEKFVKIKRAAEKEEEKEHKKEVKTQNDLSNSQLQPQLTSSGKIKKLSGHLDTNWSVKFEQLLASMLTEQDLVNFFEVKHSISQAVTLLRSKHAVERHNSKQNLLTPSPMLSPSSSTGSFSSFPGSDFGSPTFPALPE